MNVSALSMKHFSELLQKTNDRKWLRATKHLLCVPDVKEEEYTFFFFFFNDREEQKGQEKQSIPIEVIQEF